MISRGFAMIPFNVPPFVGTELQYVEEAVRYNHKISGDGPFTTRCNEWIQENLGAQKALLTTSGTASLEMAAILCDLKPGDEVILPSYTFTTTATSFVLAGAKLVFVDIRPDTMNIDERKIEEAITDRTKVIVPVHYAGVACEMDTIMDLAREYGLMVVEDAAQGVMSTYKGQALGTIGDFGCYSFHETKNYSMGEGGAIAINNSDYNDRAEIIREKGTNRSRFFRGQVDKYTWVDYGSSYLPSDMNAAYLWGQLEQAAEINENRLGTWGDYYHALEPLENEGVLRLPIVPDGCEHNGHMFYLICKDLPERSALINHLKERGISSAFHYIPLHSSPAGRKLGRFSGIDEHTSSSSDRLIRLPMYYGLSETDRKRVVDEIGSFYHGIDRKS